MTVKYHLALDGDGNGSVDIISEGMASTVTDEHPNFRAIVATISRGEDPADLLTIARQITNIDERVSINEDDDLFFDDEPIHNNLTGTILRYTREGRDTSGLVKFMERLNANPSRRSREQLFSWVQSEDLTIDQDGYFIGYKGVSNEQTSINSGPANVNGVAHNGHIPNQVGSVISMDRTQVQDDPNVACSHGLHVGNYAYANSFGRILLEVKVDPADVVSVPADSSFQKLRCCRYTVIAVHAVDVDDDLSDYEPEGFYDDEDDWSEIEENLNIPTGFMQKLRDRFGR